MEMGSYFQYYDIAMISMTCFCRQFRVRYALSKLDEGGVSANCNIQIKELCISTCPVKLNFFTQSRTCLSGSRP
jgi:hypothetical protein